MGCASSVSDVESASLRLSSAGLGGAGSPQSASSRRCRFNPAVLEIAPPSPRPSSPGSVGPSWDSPRRGQRSDLSRGDVSTVPKREPYPNKQLTFRVRKPKKVAPSHPIVTEASWPSSATSESLQSLSTDASAPRSGLGASFTMQHVAGPDPSENPSLVFSLSLNMVA